MIRIVTTHTYSHLHKVARHIRTRKNANIMRLFGLLFAVLFALYAAAIRIVEIMSHM